MQIHGGTDFVGLILDKPSTRLALDKSSTEPTYDYLNVSPTHGGKLEGLRAASPKRLIEYVVLYSRNMLSNGWGAEYLKEYTNWNMNS